MGVMALTGAAAADGRVEHPAASSVDVALRRSVDQPEMRMRERAKVSRRAERRDLGQERAAAMRQRDRCEGPLPFGGLGQGTERLPRRPDRLLDERGLPSGDEPPRQVGHLRRPPEDDREIRRRGKRLVDGARGLAGARAGEGLGSFRRGVPRRYDLGAGRARRIRVHGRVPVTDAARRMRLSGARAARQR